MKKDKRVLKKQDGFTMIELIIVIAIIGVLAAILTPTFGTVVAKSRVKADLASVRQVRQQVQLYNAEQGEYPEKSEDASEMLTVMNTKGYLNDADLTKDSQEKIVLALQTKGASITYNPKGGDVRIKFETEAGTAVAKVIDNFTEGEKALLDKTSYQPAKKLQE